MKKNSSVTRKIRTTKVKFYDEFTSANIFKRLLLALSNPPLPHPELASDKILFNRAGKFLVKIEADKAPVELNPVELNEENK